MMHENETAAASRAAETPAAPTSAGSPVQLMTAAEVLAAVDEYCATKGNPALAPVMREDYKRTGRMAPAVMESLNLEVVTMYRRKGERRG